MAVKSSGYFMVAVESFRNRNPMKPSQAKIRMRPLPGQGLDTEMLVECDRSMRKEFPLGTVFVLNAKITNKENGTPFLYSYFNDPYAVVDRQWCEERIAAKDIGFFPNAGIHSWKTFEDAMKLYNRGKPM